MEIHQIPLPKRPGSPCRLIRKLGLNYGGKEEEKERGQRKRKRKRKKKKEKEKGKRKRKRERKGKVQKVPHKAETRHWLYRDGFEQKNCLIISRGWEISWDNQNNFWFEKNNWFYFFFSFFWKITETSFFQKLKKKKKNKIFALEDLQKEHRRFERQILHSKKLAALKPFSKFCKFAERAQESWKFERLFCLLKKSKKKIVILIDF